jgi:hypothetical protein
MPRRRNMVASWKPGLPRKVGTMYIRLEIVEISFTLCLYFLKPWATFRLICTIRLTAPNSSPGWTLYHQSEGGWSGTDLRTSSPRARPPATCNDCNIEASRLRGFAKVCIYWYQIFLQQWDGLEQAYWLAISRKRPEVGGRDLRWYPAAIVDRS